DIFKYIKIGKINKAIKVIDSLDNTENFRGNIKYHYLKSIAYLACYENKNTADTYDFNYLKNAFQSLMTVRQLDNTGYKKNTNELLVRLASHFLFNGVEDFNRKQYNEALEEFENVIQINKMPEINRIDTMVYFNAAISAEKNGDTAKAIHYFETVVLMNFGGTFPIMELADLYIAQKQYDKAINLLETAFQEYPDNKDILNTLANIFLTIRKYTDAKPWIRKIIDIQPNDTLYFTLGSIYDYEHLPDSAKINYERALVLNPKNRDALYNLGVLFYLKAIKEIKMENSSKSLSDNIKAMLEQSREYLEKSFAIDNKNIEMVKILIGISKLLDNNKLEKKYKKIFENLNK
ncbi:MAG TPA: tetratricopeptide repeat protein, partial [Bacteroidales bacterium]|nr:tetratricopeptide repeat protein [Bacteroidales bacterium]